MSENINLLAPCMVLTLNGRQLSNPIKGYCNISRQIILCSSIDRQKDAFKHKNQTVKAYAIPEGVEPYYFLDKKGSTLICWIIDAEKEVAIDIQKAVAQDPNLKKVLMLCCQESLWKWLGVVDLPFWKKLLFVFGGAVIGFVACAGILKYVLGWGSPEDFGIITQAVLCLV
ncbi:MAG: hypothetical protein NWF01_08770 [Candidatus Bathyarchaeota archaeon]|nr:hypothetical protein [Candidatus Bathyarchaeota archaeon]